MIDAMSHDRAWRQRAIAARYRETVAARRVTVVNGPRQAGKTTLVRGQLEQTGGELRSLDDEEMLTAALADPVGFIVGTAKPLVIDEVQRGGEPLVRAIKASVDRDPSPGQFVLTGSSNFLTVPTISESLAGRAAFVEVWPFSQGELAGRAEQFVETLFASPATLTKKRLVGLERRELLRRVCVGGYPEAQALAPNQRAGWFRDYVRTTIERDVAQLSGIRRVAEMAQLLRLLAARSGCELVMQGVIDDAALERQAVYDHRAWLQTIHLVQLLPAWSRNITGRVKKRPKVFITDSGLAAWLIGKSPASLEDPTDPATGRLVETFVFGELRRQLTWSELEASLFHWQDRHGREVDFVLESADGRVVAVEVKAGQSPRSDWFRGLAHLRDALGERFVAGVTLYGGSQALSFGERLLAAPISALWEL
jgi:predicted AAA+ superfamily ATPase